MKYVIQHKTQLSCALNCILPGPRGHFFVAISFTFFWEWWYGVSRSPSRGQIICHLQERNSPFSSRLVSPFLSLHSVSPFSLAFLVCFPYCATALDSSFPLITSFQINQLTLLCLSNSDTFFEYLLRWEEMCSFVLAVRLNCTSSMRYNSKDMSNIYLCQRVLNGTNLDPFWDRCTWLAQ